MYDSYFCIFLYNLSNKRGQCIIPIGFSNHFLAFMQSLLYLHVSVSCSDRQNNFTPSRSSVARSVIETYSFKKVLPSFLSRCIRFGTKFVQMIRKCEIVIRRSSIVMKVFGSLTIIRKLFQHDIETSWILHGNIVDSTWKRRGFYMETSWILHGNVDSFPTRSQPRLSTEECFPPWTKTIKSVDGGINTVVIAKIKA